MDIYTLNLDLNPHDLPPGVVASVRDSGLTSGLWPVDSESGRAVIGVSPGGLYVFTSLGAAVLGWNQVHDLAIDPTRLSFHRGDQNLIESYRWLQAGHANQVQIALSERGFELSQTRETPRLRGPAGVGVRARGLLRRLFWGALGLQVLGGIVVAATWPGFEAHRYNDEVTGGREVGLVIGYLIGSVGTAIMLVALVGWAVMLGVRAARTED